MDTRASIGVSIPRNYLVRATIENGLLQRIAASAAADGSMRFRCAVHDAPQHGLTVYDYDCGRIPVGPTLMIEWEQG